MLNKSLSETNEQRINNIRLRNSQQWRYMKLTRQWLIPIFVILSVTALVVSSNQEKVRSLTIENQAQISQISDLETTLYKATKSLTLANEKANFLSDKVNIQNQQLQDLEQRLAELEIQLSEVERPIFGDEQEWTDLAYLIQAEASILSVQGKQAIASVIFNRIKSEKFPDTLSGVVWERGQFQPTFDGRMYDEKPTNEVYEAIDLALSTDNTNGSLYFANLKLTRQLGFHSNADWFEDNLEKTVQFGNVSFWK